MNIKAFLHQPVGEVKEFKVERFEEPIVIETITETENERLKKSATNTRISKSGNRVKDLDTDKYGDLLVTRCVKSPDLQNAELQAYFGTDGDAAATLKAMLLAGEYSKLTQDVLELNGFSEDESEEALKEEVKN